MPASKRSFGCCFFKVFPYILAKIYFPLPPFFIVSLIGENHAVIRIHPKTLPPQYTHKDNSGLLLEWTLSRNLMKFCVCCDFITAFQDRHFKVVWQNEKMNIFV